MGDFLPVGTVVLLENATKKLMVVGYLPRENGKKETYDYSSVLFPEGLIDSRRIIMFNNNQVKEICHESLMDEEVKRVLGQVLQVKEEI